MSSIRILPAEIANRIAAGEVIERPASVVKELVENALDAGARRIRVTARDGGRSLVQVLDDGHGMDRDDALLCLEPHATSKVREAADIERIATLGFRGEAVPSIASVSRFHLQTRRTEELAGTELWMEDGVLRDVRDWGGAPGTSVRVGHLFHNVPGRRKFLRGAATEAEHVVETVLLQALAHPDAGFELVLDDRTVIETPAGCGVAARVAQLLGRDVYDAMVPVDYEEGGIRVSGLVARPGLTRASRRDQRFFVNGRPAAAESVYAGVRDAYQSLVMKGRYPPAVLYLELDAGRVDVNVHPAKREVRFREPALVCQAVAAAVRRALRALAMEPAAMPLPPGPAPRLTPPAAGGQPAATPPAEPAPLLFSPPSSPLPGVLPSVPFLPSVPSSAPVSVSAPAPVPLAESAAPAAPGPAAESGAGGVSPSSATRAEIRALRVLGCFRQLYLVAEGPHGLVLLDQHAAHERILFERLLRRAAGEPVPSQPLLFQVTVDLAPADAALLRQALDHFTQLGFGIEPFGGNTMLVTAVPAGFPRENIGGLLRDILDDLRQHPGGAPARPDLARLAQAACKSAVKAEDPLTAAEIARLLEDLAAAEMPYTCPHGRPVMITLPPAELERRFGRRV